jgi:hypothetical protein
MRKLSRRWTCGLSRTVRSNPYSSVGMITEVKTRNLVLIRILRWNQRIRLSEWDAEEALHILVSTSRFELQLSCITLPRYWKCETTSMVSSEGENWMGSGKWWDSDGKTAKTL